MESRRARRIGIRRLTAAATATALAAVCSIFTAAPSRADMPCSVSWVARPWGDTWQYRVDAWINNTGAGVSNGWVVIIAYPDGTVYNRSWNVRPMSEYGDGWYHSLNVNGAIQPGQSAKFAIQVTLQPGVSGAPTHVGCSIW